MNCQGDALVHVKGWQNQHQGQQLLDLWGPPTSTIDARWNMQTKRNLQARLLAPSECTKV
eukprot:1160739-Pelagomonas_calceolata.AAC.9